MSYAPQRVPVDPSELSRYLERELKNISGELNSVKTKTYIPGWFASTPPSIGNGTLRARYCLESDSCELWGFLVAGSTTTFGTGSWSLELPALAKEFAQIGEARFFDSSAGLYYSGICIADASQARLSFTGNATGLLSSAVPFTWAQSDELHFHIRYLRK